MVLVQHWFYALCTINSSYVVECVGNLSSFVGTVNLWSVFWRTGRNDVCGTLLCQVVPVESPNDSLIGRRGFVIKKGSGHMLYNYVIFYYYSVTYVSLSLSLSLSL